MVELVLRASRRPLGLVPPSSPHEPAMLRSPLRHRPLTRHGGLASSNRAPLSMTSTQLARRGQDPQRHGVAWRPVDGATDAPRQGGLLGSSRSTREKGPSHSSSLPPARRAGLAVQSRPRTRGALSPSPAGSVSSAWLGCSGRVLGTTAAASAHGLYFSPRFSLQSEARSADLDPLPSGTLRRIHLPLPA
jgi:hypothetical protein